MRLPEFVPATVRTKAPPRRPTTAGIAIIIRLAVTMRILYCYFRLQHYQIVRCYAAAEFAAVGAVTEMPISAGEEIAFLEMDFNAAA